MQGIRPVAGGLMLYFLGGWSVWLDYNVATDNDYTMWTVPGLHWQVGGAFVIAVVAVLVGLACYIYCRITRPAFFRKQTLTRATPTLTPDRSLPKRRPDDRQRVYPPACGPAPKANQLRAATPAPSKTRAARSGSSRRCSR